MPSDLRNLYSNLLNQLENIPQENEFTSPYRFGETSFDQNPKQFIDRSDPNYTESIYAEPTELPSMDTGGISGQIRGLPGKLSKIVRKAMQNEMKARGIAPFEPSTKTAMQRAWQQAGGPPPEGTEEAVEALKESNVVSRLLRGTWYRGQAEYPSQARLEKVVDPVSGKEVEEFVTKQFGKEYGTDVPVMAGLRTKLSNLGEPHGISLSHDPTISAGFSAPTNISASKYKGAKDTLRNQERELYNWNEEGFLTPEEYGKGRDKLSILDRRLDESDSKGIKKVGRVLPLYGEAPEGKVLTPWKEEHGNIMRQTYIDTAKEMAEKYPAFRESLESLAPGSRGMSISDAITAATSHTKPAYSDKKYESVRDEFNSIMSRRLRESGWKGMLHHPERGGYNEYELRMFDPYEVLYVDKRAVPDSAYSLSSERGQMQSRAVARQQEMKRALREEHVAVTEGKPRSLADWYKDITREEILGLEQAGFKPLTQEETDLFLDTEKIFGKMD